MSERMARSSRLFLLGVIAACAVEVLLDWNQTLQEINVLRGAIRQKGENYVGILAKASDDELLAADRVGLERLSHGIFDDEDAVYVRFTDTKGTVVWDKVKEEFSQTFRSRGNTDSFAAHYAKLMDRDTQRALHDPEGLKTRVANSRYKDFAQAWTDATAKVVAAFVPPRPEGPARGTVVYEDRLRDDKREKDESTSYAIATVLGEDGRDIGTVIVAFDMERTNAAVRMKYFKFAGLCSFFVALILVQRTVSRRNTLWLLDLQRSYEAAKLALVDAMPHGDVRCRELVARGAVDQAAGPVDGMVWNAADEGQSLLVVVVDPDGDGVDAAAVGLHVLRAFDARRQGAAGASLDDEMRALGEAASGIPLTRPLGVLLLRVHAGTGAFEALGGTMARLRITGGGAASTPPLRPAEIRTPEGILGPLSSASGVVAPGQALVALCTGSKVGGDMAEALAAYLARTHEPGKFIAVQDAAIWARGRSTQANQTDLAVVAVSRQGDGDV